VVLMMAVEQRVAGIVSDKVDLRRGVAGHAEELRNIARRVPRRPTSFFNALTNLKSLRCSAVAPSPVCCTHWMMIPERRTLITELQDGPARPKPLFHLMMRDSGGATSGIFFNAGT
jgi:hypothetical protein